jgi:membrane-bound lytic murein transglycosylase B
VLFRSFHYLDNSAVFVTGFDLVSGIGKSVFFGAAIALISCYQGFNSEGGAEGVGKAGIAALMGSSYAKATINADRNQKSFKYALDKFLQVRGADAIASQGKSRKAKNAKLFDSLEAQYGVPAGVI